MYSATVRLSKLTASDFIKIYRWSVSPLYGGSRPTVRMGRLGHNTDTWLEVEFDKFM